jgi:Transposase and inactivated derivatives
MARTARVLPCTAESRHELEAILKSRKQKSGLYLRVRIVLQCMDGWKIADIAKANRVSMTTVMRWKNRYLELGFPGLKDYARSGRPARYKQEFRTTVLAKLEEEPPAGYSQWDGALLAVETGYSKHAIWRLLRSQRICLARKRSWCVSTDPEFAVKAANVVGLYLSPPESALVICVDEKPNIQALDRSTGYAVSADRRLVRALESTYKRNGTLNLFAALDVATGYIYGKTTEPSKKTKKGFLEFMDELLLELPDSGEYHVIMDNHSIHKRHELWLDSHPNVFFHYTPTSASWLNMVEIWFGILTLKSLRGASFSTTQELGAHIKAFQDAYNETAQPFVWKKREVKGAQLTNSIRNFCN